MLDPQVILSCATTMNVWCAQYYLGHNTGCDLMWPGDRSLSDGDNCPFGRSTAFTEWLFGFGRLAIDVLSTHPPNDEHTESIDRPVTDWSFNDRLLIAGDRRSIGCSTDCSGWLARTSRLSVAIHSRGYPHSAHGPLYQSQPDSVFVFSQMLLQITDCCVSDCR